MRTVIMLIAIAGFAMAATDAQAATIGIFADPAGTSTNISLSPGVPGTFYILATLEEAAAEQFQGLDFRVTGMPASWSTTAVPHPESDVFWPNPFDSPGPSMVWGDCQTGTNGIVILYTVTVVATNDVPSATLNVIKHDYESIPEFQCPLMVTCGPDFQMFCANGGQATIDVDITNDTCETAIPIPWCTTYTTTGNTDSYSGDYTPSVQLEGDGCTGRWAPGPDAVYQINLIPGLVVNATYTPSTFDGSLYLITDCSNPQESCLVGSDNPGDGIPETITWTVETPGIHYLICDSWDQGGGPYTLEVNIDCTVSTEAMTWGAVKTLFR